MSFAAFSRREWWKERTAIDPGMVALGAALCIPAAWEELAKQRRLINALTLATNADADPEHIPPAVRL